MQKEGLSSDTKNNSFTDLLKYMDKRSVTSREQFPLISMLRIVLVSTPIAFARSFCVCLEDFLLSRMMFATAISVPSFKMIVMSERWLGVPSDKVDMLVKYYDVTADYILYGDESYKFLKLLDSLSPMQKRKILPAIESMILAVST